MTDRISNIINDPQPQDLNGSQGKSDRSDASSALVFVGSPQSESASAELPGASTNDVRSPWKTAIALVLVLLIGAVGFWGMRNLGASNKVKDKSADKKQKVTPVLIATVTQKTVPVQIKAIGNVQPGVTVSVTPQVSGRIKGVFFQKGQQIKKGQLLFTLDEQPQAAAVEQSQGVILKDRAQVQQNQATADKDTGAIAQAQATLAKDLQAVEQAKAILARDTGLIAQARATLAKDLGLVKQAQAILAKDLAQSKLAQAQNQRYNSLYKQGAISQDQAQQYLASSQVSTANIQADMEAIRNAEIVVASDRIAIQNAEATVRGDQAAIKNAEAVVQGDRVAIANAIAVVRGDQAAIRNAQASITADQGALKNAQVQLGYTKIYAPIDGRAGNILVQVGNVVQPSSNNPLVTIVQVNPIQVSFSVPANNLSEIQKRLSNGKLPVDIKLSDADTKSIPGFLTFVNNTVDNTTGTIQLIGDFNNVDGKLWPGQYVNATLTLSEVPNTTVVPAQAVQNGPNGQFVFVVKSDMTVDNVPVVTNSAIDGFNAIAKGLNPGDRVVIDGQANLVAGDQVKLKQPGGDQPSDGAKTGRSGRPKTDQKSSDPVTGDLPAPSNPTPSGDRPHRRSGKRHSSPTPSQPAGVTP